MSSLRIGYQRDGYMGYKTLAHAVIERALLDVGIIRDPRTPDPFRAIPVTPQTPLRYVTRRLVDLREILAAATFLFRCDDPHTLRWYDWAGIDREAMKEALWTPRVQLKFQRLVKEQARLEKWRKARYAEGMVRLSQYQREYHRKRRAALQQAQEMVA